MESDKSDSDSELSTANKTFTFDSEQLDSDDEMKTIFEWNYVYHDNIKKSEELPNANTYLKHVSSCTRLNIIPKKRIFKFLKKGPIAFFHLSIRKSFFSDCIRKWTNRTLDSRRKPTASIEKMLEVVGIEIGMSYLRMKNMKSYWTKTFIGSNEDCGKMIGRDWFLEIWKCLSFCSDYETRSKSHLVWYNDPLFYARNLMNRFNKNSTKLTVPTGENWTNFLYYGQN